MSDIVINGITYPEPKRVAFPGSDGKPVIFDLPEDAEAALNPISERPVQNKVIYNAITAEAAARQAADTLIQAQLTSPFNFRGSVADLAALVAISSPAQNDTYRVISESCRYSYTGNPEVGTSGWVQSSMDESEYESELAGAKNAVYTASNLAKGLIIPDIIINKNSGNVISASGYLATDFIPVMDSVYVWAYSANNNAGYCFYDEEKHAVSGSYGAVYDIRGVYTKLTVPYGAKYFRISCYGTYADDFCVYSNISPVYKTVNELDDALSLSYEVIDDWVSGYIRGDLANTTYAVVESTSYKHQVINCAPDDVFTINGVGANAARLWFFANDAGNIVSRAEVNETGPSIIVAPIDAVKLVICNSANDKSLSYKGVYMISDCVRDLYRKGNRVNVANESFSDDLLNDKLKNKFLSCLRGTTNDVSNYGLPNTRYVFAYKQTNKVHVCFDFRFTDIIPLDTSRTDIYLFQDARTGMTIRLSTYRIIYDHLLAKRSVYVNDGVTPKAVNSANYDTFLGKPAFYVQYTGAYDDVSLVFGADHIQVKRSNETVLYSVFYSLTDTVATVFNRLTDLADITGELYFCTNHTCADLAIYNGLSIPLYYAETLYEETSPTIVKPRIYIPYALDDRWHTFEIIIDQDNLAATFSVDGLTFSTDIDSSGLTDQYKIICGGTTTYKADYIKLRNLKVDLDGFGDAEVIYNRVWPYDAEPTMQMISDRNPKVMVFEAHGLYDGLDSDAGIPDISTSTDRLSMLLELLSKNNYASITVSDLVDWKYNGKPLPKRSFMLIFDDVRFENYAVYNLRKPLVKFNVSAVLAMITGQVQDTYTYEGTTYTKDQCIDMVQKNGWSIVSHTRNHRHINATSVTESYEEFKADVLSADALGVRSDVIVYPFGSSWNAYNHVLQDSGFKLGIDIYQNRYNCRLTNNYSLSRVDIRSSIPLERFLSQFDESEPTT